MSKDREESFRGGIYREAKKLESLEYVVRFIR